MIVGLKILDDFVVEDAEELVKELIKRNLIDFTLDEVKKLVEEAYEGQYKFDDVQLEDDCIDFILSDLAKGNFYWEFKDGVDNFTIYVIDPDNPYTKSGKVPQKNKVKVDFT